MAVARWLETDTNTNKDISSAVSIGAYTADADRMIVCDVSLDAVAGNGDYVIYVTRQINGAGSAYVLLPKTTCAAASGETAIAMQSGMISVRSGDVLTVYLDGLAGDTTTPDTTVRWFEMAALRPATADRTLAVDASGLVDLVDAPNATAVAAIQNGLATYGDVAGVLSSVNAQTAIQIGMIQAVVGAKGNRAVVASAGTITGGSEQSGTYGSTKALDNASNWQVGGSTSIDFYLEFDVPEGAVLRAVVVRAECNNNQIPTYYISNNASDWTSIGQQSEAVPDDYEVDTLIVPVADAVTAGASGKLYVRLTAGYYAPLTVQVSYLAIVVEDAASGGGSSAQEVWEYTTRTLTQSSTSTTDSTAAGSIARRRGDSWSISLTIGAITGYTSLWFTAKWDRDDPDISSVLQIKLNSPSTSDGLLYVNGAAASDSTKGSITVSDDTTGAIIIAVDETITQYLPPAGLYYDIQVLNSGTVTTPDSGTLTITADVTRDVA